MLSPALGFIAELLLARRYGNTGTMDAYRVSSTILLLGTALLLTNVLLLILGELGSRAYVIVGVSAAGSVIAVFVCSCAIRLTEATDLFQYATARWRSIRVTG